MQQPSRIPHHWWWVGSWMLVVAVVLPVLASWSRSNHQDRCRFDGQRIVPLYRVEVIAGEEGPQTFCCLLCAELWLMRTEETPQQILVIDEQNEKPIEAADATYVRSSVFSNEPTGDRRHVFLHRKDAETHAQEFQGRILEGAQRPFATRGPFAARE